MSSKLIHSHKPFFSKMVVDAVLSLDQNDLNENLIGMKKVPGGAMEVSTGESAWYIRAAWSNLKSRLHRTHSL